MFSEKQKAVQPEFWVATHQLPKSPKATFYSKLDETLEGFGFAEKARQICAPADKQRNADDPRAILREVRSHLTTSEATLKTALEQANALLVVF